jgi:CubicO group peptidase (beta-lactamase class C family)
MIAEKAGGKPLFAQFQSRLFKPLGLKVWPLDDTNAPGFPEGHHRYALGPVRPATPPARGWLWAAGELSMSAADLAKWDIARIERKLLPREDWEEMERPVALKDGKTTNYGLGVFRQVVGGRVQIDHGGESVGFLSQNRVWPESRAAVVVLTNADFGGAEGKISDAVSQIILPASETAAAPSETPRTADARADLESLANGTFNPAHFTENAQYYFKPTALGDYRETLVKLGPPTELAPVRAPRLRGGFVNRVFKVTWPGKTLYLSTYAEPGAAGRWEQFLLTE